MLGAQVVVCLGVFKTIRPTGIMAGQIHVAPALITRSGPFFIRCGSGATNLLSLYMCDITTGEIRTRGWRRWWRRRGEKKKTADASLDVAARRSTRAWPSFLVPTLHSTTSLAHFQDSETLVLIQLSLFLYASLLTKLTFCLGYWSFWGDLHQTKEFQAKKKTPLEFGMVSLRYKYFSTSLFWGKKKDDEGSKQH